MIDLPKLITTEYLTHLTLAVGAYLLPRDRNLRSRPSVGRRGHFSAAMSAWAYDYANGERTDDFFEMAVIPDYLIGRRHMEYLSPFISSVQMLATVARLDWSFWRARTLKPGVNKREFLGADLVERITPELLAVMEVEFGGYIFVHGREVYNPILFRGGPCAIVLGGNLGKKITIHSHPACMPVKDIADIVRCYSPSVADLRAATNNGWQVVVCYFGLFLYKVDRAYSDDVLKQMNLVYSLGANMNRHEDWAGTFSMHGVYIGFFSWDDLADLAK
jgi:hypothetical protein